MPDGAGWGALLGAAAAVALESDGEAFGLTEVGRDVDVVLGVCGGAGEEGRGALVEEGVIGADGEARGGFLAFVALDLGGWGVWGVLVPLFCLKVRKK